MSKIVYIAHPIGGDVEGNIQKIKEIVRGINLREPDVVPFAPYLSDVLALDDDIPEHRTRGFANNKRIFDSGIIDELWVYGASEGVEEEINWAIKQSIPIDAKLPHKDTEGLSGLILDARLKIWVVQAIIRAVSKLSKNK